MLSGPQGNWESSFENAGDASQIPEEVVWSRLLVEPVASRISDWLEAGKVDDADLESTLTSNARAVVDAGTVGETGLPMADVESLVSILASQLGGDPALAEWASELLDLWERENDAVKAVFEEAGRLVDGAGYAAGRLAEKLFCRADWSYTGGRTRFEVRLRGLGQGSTGLRSLLGALLAGAAERANDGFADVRFSGVDSKELVIFATSEEGHAEEDDAEAYSFA